MLEIFKAPNAAWYGVLPVSQNMLSWKKLQNTLSSKYMGFSSTFATKIDFLSWKLDMAATLINKYGLNINNSSSVTIHINRET